MHTKIRATNHATFRPVSLGTLQLTSGFWARRQEINQTVSIPHGYRMLEKAGNLNNLRLAAGKGEGNYRGYVFQDSDVYKWLEAACLASVPLRARGTGIANNHGTGIQQMIHQVIGIVAKAQQADGYLNSCFSVERPGQRWTDIDHGHELYCAGHLIEAAVAHNRVTGETSLMDVARRFVDHIGAGPHSESAVFGPGKREYAPGHPEIELALVELYRQTGERSYLDLAKFFIDQRGHNRMRGWGNLGSAYQQDRVPVRQTEIVEGHAVRQLYLDAGVADLYLETGERALLEALERQWQDMAQYKTYITGAFGARGAGEAFGGRYELPNREAYCETCAAIAAMMWNWRMLLITGRGIFADLLERSLYNGFLSGLSLDGTHFFYENPLLNDGSHRRQEWFACACCPPNVMRQIALVDHYAFTVNETGVQIHQYQNGKASLELPDGSRVGLRIATSYPWEGSVRIIIEETTGSWTLRLRKPGWCKEARVGMNGRDQTVEVDSNGYLNLGWAWRRGDEVELEMAMVPRLTVAHPRVDDLRGMAAIERGPLVYCLEGMDQREGINLADVRIPTSVAMQGKWRDDILGGLGTVQFDGLEQASNDWGNRLYRAVGEGRSQLRPTLLTAIPYYAWANRTASPMRVWLPLIG